MSRFFLTRIKIEGFRGINNDSDPLEMKFRHNAVNSVFAVNGVGKTSIYEALTYAIRGVIPKLADLQAQEHPDEYIANRFHSKGTACIELEFQDDDGISPPVTIQVNRDAGGKRTVTSSSGHANPESLLASMDQDFTLLDYRTFTKFIDSSPLERGRSFSTLLGLSDYSDFRQALQTASETRTINSDFEITALRATINACQDSVQAAMRRLQAAYLELSGKPLTDTSQLDTYTREVTDALAGIELIRSLVDKKKLGEIDFNAIKEKIKTAEGGDQRKELEKLIETITELDGLGAPDEKIAAEQADLQRLLRERTTLLESTPGVLLKELYDAADVVISKGAWVEPDKCPLCESELTGSIDTLVSHKLHQYEQVSQKGREIDAACQDSLWLRRLDSLERSKSLDTGEDKRLAVALKRNATEQKLTLPATEEAIAALGVLEAKRTEALEAARNRKTELEKELPPSLVSLTEQIGYAQQYRDALKDFHENSEKKDRAATKLSMRERWRDFMAKAASTFATAEAELSRRKIASIDTEYKTMFARIMGVKDVIPELRRAEPREDLFVELCNFHGLANVSARALLSESYRNALAISVFLSAAVKNAGVSRFVLLDDVTSSFDSGHQWNLMEAIRLGLQCPKNPDGLQFIVLSHDGLLEKYFDRLGNTSDWHHQRLQGYPPMGAVISQTQDSNRLKGTATKLLTAGQVKEAEPLLRQYLEFQLLRIINKVQIPVPLDFAIKDHEKMVSNSLDAINDAIRLHKKAGSLILDAKQVSEIDTILVPALVGNWVSHYETGAGSSLTPPVLLSVIQTIDDFAECFRYDDTSSGTAQRRWYKSLSSR